MQLPFVSAEIKSLEQENKEKVNTGCFIAVRVRETIPQITNLTVAFPNANIKWRPQAK